MEIIKIILLIMVIAVWVVWLLHVSEKLINKPPTWKELDAKLRANMIKSLIRYINHWDKLELKDYIIRRTGYNEYIIEARDKGYGNKIEHFNTTDLAKIVDEVTKIY